MSLARITATALLVVVAGCTGANPAGGDTTTAPTPDTTTVPTTQTDTATPTDSTTPPHTAKGTSHTATHFVVSAGANVDNVTVTLAPDGDSETYELDAADDLDLTREIHERGHDVRVVVERGDETVFDESVLGYEYYDVTVYENETNVEHAVV
jgi:hypothetical protein